MTKPNAMGATFAERKAAADGADSFDAPTASTEHHNATFSERRGGTKAVQESENKAVRSADSKSKRKS